jgi:hypothetical protein
MRVILYGMAASDADVPTAFVISPIGASGTESRRKANQALKYVIKAALEPEYRVIRADQEDSPDSISAKMIERIIESGLVVADLTDSNPNVFYELAVAHSFQRPVVHIMDAQQSPPFDVVDQRVIPYDLRDLDSVDEAKAAILSAAREVLGAKYHPKNPISAYGRFATISHLEGGEPEPIASSLIELAAAIQRIERRLDKQDRDSHKNVSSVNEKTLRQARLAAQSQQALPSEAELLAYMQEQRNARKIDDEIPKSWQGDSYGDVDA